MPKEPLDELTDRVSSLEDGHKRLEKHLKDQDASIGEVNRLATETHGTVQTMSEKVSEITDTWIGGPNQRGVKDLMLEIREDMADRKVEARDRRLSAESAAAAKKSNGVSILIAAMSVVGTAIATGLGWLIVTAVHAAH